MVQGPTRSTVQGSYVLRAVVLAALATSVVPPAGAWWLNSQRVAVTTERVASIAREVASLDDGAVVCGPGRLPDADVRGAQTIHAAWITAAVSRPAAFGAGMPTDAWGRCFLSNDRWILSAGPNGVVETAFSADVPGGDDIGARRR